ncbi:Hypothetical protein CINCED_3A008620 [Cinara cedri]|uniref:Uncharacterized protein n=1 Tax=Cinara cedri TaxID=506608 RepID=A0A5E4MC18_9HEMI|nr:Hypothetical protein CINCED_3A008620 [Cinara cedri]
MTSNDSGVESSTDNDDCAQPQPMFNKKSPMTATASGMSVVPVHMARKPQDFPLFCFKPGVTEPMMFTRPPLLDEVPTRKLKCLFELANPSFSGTFDRFQSCLTPIQEYNEMLLKLEEIKEKRFLQTKKSIGPCRVHTCRGYLRPNILESRDNHKLCRAANLNNTEVLAQLLHNGVNPNCWDSRKRTPLHLAASKGYAEAVELLLKYGANPNLKDALGNNPLHLAACTHHMDVVTLLLKGGILL